MDSSGLSKKEYLKKYLGGGEKKKKKKKSTQSLIIKSKIVDDDIDLKSMKPVNEDELDIYDLAEEAPQIVGIIDERPDDIRLMSEFRSTKKWKIVADGIEDVKITSVDHRKTDEGSSRVEKEISIQITKNIDKSKSDSDESPPRSKKTSADGVDLEILKNIKKEIVSDSSPPRKSTNKRKDELRSGDRYQNSDANPPVRTIKKEKDDSDTSPPRRRKEKEDSDTSPPRRRKNKSDSDTSPPRRKRHKDDSDASPPRRGAHKDDSDASPPRRRRHKDDLVASPPRKRGHKDDSDASPPRRKKRGDSDSPPLRKRKSLESSPPRKGINNRKKESTHHLSGRSEERSRRSRSPEKLKNKKNGDYGLKVISNKNRDTKREKESSRIEKTLLGKKAGLQSAEDMKKQDEKFRQKEKEMFEKMSDEMTGRHATAVVRNRKTGRVFNEKEEARKKRKQEEKEAEKIALYAVWGKGVKQVKDRQDKIEDDLYEMSKPLARYKDDKDLDEMLKNQERDGDPMLEYIRKKKKTEFPKTSKVEYEGLYFPNRYDIKPGHQWDGVDRSNGFEKKWFEEQSAKKAREEEAFKWSTYDM